MDFYGCNEMRSVTGDTIRPGGFMITERAVTYCMIEAGSRLLDVGCGIGASVNHLIDKYRINAVGIDPTESLLRIGKEQAPNVPVYDGRAEAIPFPDESMDTVLSECCLSHYVDRHKALCEIYRVLSPRGWLIVSDMYLRSGSFAKGAASQHALFGEDAIINDMQEHGFKTVLWEDHTKALKRLYIDIILKFGTLKSFREQTGCSCNHCCELESQDAKIGYYLLIARK
jgi:ubiquinone/menaquinone biosynthesis C-methylase UbiE